MGCFVLYMNGKNIVVCIGINEVFVNECVGCNDMSDMVIVYKIIWFDFIWGFVRKFFSDGYVVIEVLD